MVRTHSVLLSLSSELSSIKTFIGLVLVSVQVFQFHHVRY